MGKEQAREFLLRNGIKQNELAEYLGITEASVSRFVNGVNKLSPQNLRKILNNNRGWDVSMLDEGIYYEVVAPREKTPKASSDVHQIPLVPIYAHAGYLEEVSEGIMPYQCEMISAPMVGATCAIRIIGDSMEPKYSSGSIAILQKINEAAFIEWGRCYVLSTANGPIIKEVHKTEDPNVIECVSLNPKYQPFTVETRYINGWYRLLGVWSFV